MRLIAATVLTVAALPLLMAESRSAKDPARVAVVGPASAAAGALPGRAATPTTTAAAPSPGIASEAAPDLPVPGSGTTPPPSAATKVIDVAVPAAKPENLLDGDGAYRRWTPGSVGTLEPCATPAVGVGRRVTVQNLDNGLSVTCVNVSDRPLSPGFVIVLDTPLFERLADLAQAPVPVRLTW